jgi:two-component system, probable response regulator PhcQ
VLRTTIQRAVALSSLLTDERIKSMVTHLDYLPSMPTLFKNLVVSDEQMPEMSGSTLLAEVRRRHPDTGRIILTGRASVEAAIRAINEGHVFRFLLKPCLEAELICAIRQALQLRALQCENSRLTQALSDQAEQLRDLELSNPDITRVERTADGTIVIGDGEDLAL